MAVEDTRPNSRFGLITSLLGGLPCRNFLHGVLDQSRPMKKDNTRSQDGVLSIFMGLD